MKVQKENRCINDSSSSTGPVKMKWEGKKKLETSSDVLMTPLSKAEEETKAPNIN